MAALSSSQVSCPKTLEELCTAFMKENLHLTAEVLSGLNQQVITQLAISLPPSELLRLEECFGKDPLKKAWKYLCKKHRHLIREFSNRPQYPCSSAFGSAVSSYRDLWLTFYVSKCLYYLDADDCLGSGIESLLILFYGDKGHENEDWFLAWTPEEFQNHCVKLARKTKEVNVRSSKLQKLCQNTQVMQAFQENLVSLSINLLNDKSIIYCLKVLRHLLSRGQLKHLQLVDTTFSSIYWDLVFFICSGMFDCQPCAQHFAAGMKQATENIACSFQPEAIHEQQFTSITTQNSVDSLCGQLSLTVMDVLSNLSYPGLAEYSLHVDTGATVKEYDDILCQKEDSSPPNRMEPIPSHTALPSNHTDTDGTVTGLNSTSGLVFSNDDDKDNDVSTDSAVTRSESTRVELSDDTDLMNEALATVSGDMKTIDIMHINSHNERKTRLCDIPFHRLRAELSKYHRDQNHRSQGLEALSLRRPWRPDYLSALACNCSYSAVGWESLSTLHLPLQLSMDLKDLTTALLERVRQGSLKDLGLVIYPENFFEDRTQEQNSEDETFEEKRLATSSSIAHLEQFFWDVLQALASCRGTNQDYARPVHQLQMLMLFDNPVFLKTVEGNESSLLSNEKTFRGLETLHLDTVGFRSVKVFSQLTQFLGQDEALSHLTLKGSELNSSCVDLLLMALCSKGAGSLKYLNLTQSLSGLSDSQWQMMCCLLSRQLALMFLSLSQCGITNKQIMSEEFIAAIRQHKDTRNLSLDLSFNTGKYKLVDFLSAVVCPDSSLQNLYIQCRDCTLTREAAELVRDRLALHFGDQLPLLHTIEVSVAGSQSDLVLPILHQISKHVTVLEEGCIMADYLAQM